MDSTDWDLRNEISCKIIGTYQKEERKSAFLKDLRISRLWTQHQSNPYGNIPEISQSLRSVNASFSVLTGTKTLEHANNMGITQVSELSIDPTESNLNFHVGSQGFNLSYLPRPTIILHKK